jgi:glycosyltransferase involved in cell wall biosynthesis
MELDQPLISFCIPTYNRSQLILGCIKSIIDFQGNEIEIVVVDNNSPDNTQDIITSINDTRVKYYKNNINLGVVVNIIETIKKARGKWVFTLSDEDIVKPETIRELVKIIHENNYPDASVLIGNIRNFSGPYPYYIYHNGSDYVKCQYQDCKYDAGDIAISVIGFDHKYLSGIMFRKDCINEQTMNIYSNKEGLIAPHTVFYTIAASKGDAVTLNVDFCYRSVDKSKKSYVENQNSQHYKHPDNRFKQFVLYVNLANEIVKDIGYKMIIFAKLFGYYLDESTYGWYNFIHDKYRMNYYGVVDTNSYADLTNEINKFVEKAKIYLSGLLNHDEHYSKLSSIIDSKVEYFVKKRNINYH